MNLKWTPHSHLKWYNPSRVKSRRSIRVERVICHRRLLLRLSLHQIRRSYLTRITSNKSLCRCKLRIQSKRRLLLHSIQTIISVGRAFQLIKIWKRPNRHRSRLKLTNKKKRKSKTTSHQQSSIMTSLLPIKRHRMLPMQVAIY